MKVAIVGGTGPFGLALATRLVEAGDEVVLGSRDAARAQEKAQEVGCRGDVNEQAIVGVDFVVLATNANIATVTAKALGRARLDSPLLSVASRIAFSGRWGSPPSARSVAEQIAQVVDVPVAAGLHSLGAKKLAESRPDEEAFVCGDHEAAKALALELAGKLVSGRVLDAGPLACARALEGMTAVMLNVNKRYKGHAGIRVTGLPKE